MVPTKYFTFSIASMVLSFPTIFSAHGYVRAISRIQNRIKTRTEPSEEFVVSTLHDSSHGYLFTVHTKLIEVTVAIAEMAGILRGK